MMNEQDTRPTILICPTILQRWESSIDVVLNQAGFNIQIPEGPIQDTSGISLVIYVGGLMDDTAHELNKTCSKSATPLLVITPAKEVVCIGPLVLVGQTPCVECYQKNAEYLPYNGYDRPADNAFTDQQIELVMPHIESAVTAVLLQQDHLLYAGYTIEFDANGGETKKSRGCRAGNCTTCSTWIAYPTESHLSAYSDESH